MSNITQVVKSQKKTFSKEIKLDGKRLNMSVMVRYDDECGNGHNTFSMTVDIRTLRGGYYMGGCCHEKIKTFFPELAPYVKWHLTSSDGPMHYIDNSLYHARTTTHKGKRVGEPVSFETRLGFKGMPFTFSEHTNGFFDYLKSLDGDIREIGIIPIEHKSDPETYSCKYTLSGVAINKEWYQCPFDTKNEAEEFLRALNNFKMMFIEVPTEWCEAVEPNLDYARSSAVWTEAELEDFTEENLIARLPGLMTEFRNDVESLGFVY